MRRGHALVLIQSRSEIHTALGRSRAGQPRTALRSGVDVHPLALLHRGGTPVHLHRRRPHAPRSLRPLPPSLRLNQSLLSHSPSRLPNGASFTNHPLPSPHSKPCKTPTARHQNPKLSAPPLHSQTLTAATENHVAPTSTLQHSRKHHIAPHSKP